MLDIFAIEPNVVSRDMKGYSFLVYGGPKVGKTTFATRFENSLLLGFEKGYSALPGVMAAPINTWAEFIKVLSQLKQDVKRVEVAHMKGEKTAKTRFDYIVIDVADIAYDYCSKYVCQRAGVDTVADIPFGGGYGQIETEFDERLRSIVQMGYGLIIISHEAEGREATEEKEGVQAKPTLDKRALKVCSRLVDVYMNMYTELDSEGVAHRMFQVRENERAKAGTRFETFPDVIPASYEAVSEAFKEAIKSMEGVYGSEAITETLVNHFEEEEKIPFAELKQATLTKCKEMLDSKTDPAEKKEMAINIKEITERHLGKDGKVSNADRAQYNLLEAIFYSLDDLK